MVIFRGFHGTFLVTSMAGRSPMNAGSKRLLKIPEIPWGHVSAHVFVSMQDVQLAKIVHFFNCKGGALV